MLTVRRLLGEDAIGAVTRFESRFERWRPAVRTGRLARARRPGRGGRAALRPREPSGRPGPRPVRAPDAGLRRGRAPASRRRRRRRHVRRARARAAACAATSGSAPSPPSPRRACGSSASPAPTSRTASTARRTRCATAGARASRTGVGSRASAGGGSRATTRSTQIETEPGAYERFYAGVERWLREGAPPPVDPADAVIGLEILEAALASAEAAEVVALRAGLTEPPRGAGRFGPHSRSPARRRASDPALRPAAAASPGRR